MTHSRSFPAALAAVVGVAGLAVAVAPVPKAAPPTADTGQLGGGRARANYFPGARLPERPAVLWTFTTDAAPHDPVFADGVVYVGDEAGTLYAIGADGHPLWRSRDAARGGDFSAPQVAGSRVYFSTARGVEVVRQSDGAPLWRHDIEGGACGGSPLVLGGRVYAAGANGIAYALDAASGVVTWKHDLTAGPQPGKPVRPRTPASDGVSLFLPVNDPSGLFALDLATGRPAWSFAAARDWGAHPTVAGRVVLAGDLGGRLRALDRVTGGLAWEFQAPNGIDAGAAVRGGDAFVADCSGRLRRLDLRTGRAAWTFETPRERRGNRTVGGTPLVTDGAVAFGSGDGFVYCLDPGTGAPRWELEPAADSEVAATLCPGGGRLFAAVRKCGFPRPRGRGIDAIVATGEAP